MMKTSALKGTILVIDDEETMHDACNQVLSREGYRIITALDGKRGMGLLLESGPDIVLLDYQLHDMSGKDMLRDIGAFDPTIVKVVMTGYATIESAVEAMKHGASDFLPKPFTADELRIIVNRSMERRHFLVEKKKFEEETSRIRENFVSVMTHEMRSPLVGVQQYLDVILEGYSGEITQKQRALLEKCKHRTKWLLSLVNEWLEMSRMQETSIIERLEQVDIRKVLEESVELLRLNAENKKITLSFNVPQNLPKISGNHEALVHLFMNLFSNAIKYNYESGKVTATVIHNGDEIIVAVNDTGIGIPEEMIPFIFDEFFRVRSIREKARKVAVETGTGLGLAITKKIVDAHHGFVTVTSKEEAGTTISVHLPINYRKSVDEKGN